MNELLLKDLKERLSYVVPLDSLEISKLYEELLSFFSESEEEYLLRRHKELRENGYKNKKIFSILSSDIKKHLFRGQELSERQIKRIIYDE